MSENEVRQLPYLRSGAFAAQWGVKARTYEAFLKKTLRYTGQRIGRPLRVLDLGAGNCWLARRVSEHGHNAIAVDIRNDTIDGLGAASFPDDERIDRTAATFDSLPFRDGVADLVVFNASFHYSPQPERTLREARRVCGSGGAIVIMDTPFYKSAKNGQEMVREKRESAPRFFGDLADDLLAIPAVEFLTGDSLAAYSRETGLNWRRHRVRYPLWYEMRPLRAFFRRKRSPSRFDLWEAVVP